TVGVALVPELTLSAYGGFAALPRWDRRPGYYHLGSAADSLVTEPEAFGEPLREQFGGVGGRMSFDHEKFHAALSMHEQRDSGELGRRNIGLDAGVPLTDLSYFGGSMLLDVDSMRLTSGRAFFDVTLEEDWDLSAEYLQAEPALLLSRQSVLSVFSTSGYREVGGTASYRVTQELRIGAGGYAQFYDDSLPGPRATVDARVRTSMRPDATTFLFGYGRVDAVEVGYHSARVAASQPLPHELLATLQGYAYFYDDEISGYDSSLTGALTVAYPFASQWEVLWG